MNATERAGEALRWLRFAEEDLREAEQLVARSHSVPRHICWFAQQAAEKALKAALILEDMEVPFWHNLDALRNLLPPGWSVKQEHPDAERDEPRRGPGRATASSESSRPLLPSGEAPRRVAA